METASLKELTIVISLIITGLTVCGVLAALIFFGLTLRRIIQLLPAVLCIAVFAIALPLTVSRLRTPVVYQSRANPADVKILSTENKRIDGDRVVIKIILDRPAQVYLKYTGPGRDFIIPVASNVGSKREKAHTFDIAKKDPAAGSAVVVIEGVDRDTLVIN